jgi:hypothetical protein
MSDSGIIKLPDFEKPLCPYVSTDPGNKAHELYVRAQNVVYDTAEKDADGEILDPKVADIMSAVSYIQMNERMDLYFVRNSLPFSGVLKQAVVESYYYKCHICGFILPAYKI